MGHAVGVLDVNAELGTRLPQSSRPKAPVRFIARRERRRRCGGGGAVASRRASGARAGHRRRPDSQHRLHLEMDLTSTDRMWRVNYHGSVHAARSFGRRMVAAAGGAIVTLGSINSPRADAAAGLQHQGGHRAPDRTAGPCEMGRTASAPIAAPTFVMTDQLRAACRRGPADLGRMMAVARGRAADAGGHRGCDVFLVCRPGRAPSPACCCRSMPAGRRREP